MDGQYIGGVYTPPAGMTEYNRRLALFNIARQLYVADYSLPVKIDRVIEDARKLEEYLTK